MKLEVEACSELHQETGTGLLSPASESPGLDNALWCWSGKWKWQHLIMSTSLPLPSVSQVELLKLFGPERPELDLPTEVSCDDDLQPQIFFVVKDFLVSPSSLVLHILQRPDPRAYIPVQLIIADLQ